MRKVGNSAKVVRLRNNCCRVQKCEKLAKENELHINFNQIRKYICNNK